MSATIGHLPVLMAPVLEALRPGAGRTFVDATAGRGGHAEAMARALGAGRLLLLDLDAGNLEFAAARVRTSCPSAEVRAVHGSFAGVDRACRAAGWRVDGLLADLGFASNQMDDPERGFSFQGEGPLDMRLDRSHGETAADLLARLPERELADAIFQLGEDPFARRIARVLVDRRARGGLRSTADLAAAVQAAYGARARQSRMHPATRTFMALRILVNDELGALRSLLEALEAGGRGLRGADGWLAEGARAGIIAFHSLEDRLVKHAFAEWERAGIGRRLTRKPVEASDDEARSNPRSRSAKFRVFEFTSETASPR